MSSDEFNLYLVEQSYLGYSIILEGRKVDGEVLYGEDILELNKYIPFIKMIEDKETEIVLTLNDGQILKIKEF
nr:MAG TPA: hypothetical protein [Caudoviricetes sp.]